jgi:hypothetical protein
MPAAGSGNAFYVRCDLVFFALPRLLIFTPFHLGSFPWAALFLEGKLVIAI